MFKQLNESENMIKNKTFIFDYNWKTTWQKPATQKGRIFASDLSHAKEILNKNFGHYQSDIVPDFDTLKETNYCLVSHLWDLGVKY